MKEIGAFHDVLADIPSVASKINSEGRRILGYMCSYAPEELIHAAGFHPMRLFPGDAEITLAEDHLQSYCCSVVRGVLEEHLAGRLDFLHGALFPHTCDSVQRLSDIWRMNGRYAFFADVVLPVKLGTASAASYMNDVLERFKSALEKAAGNRITDEDIGASIKIYNRIRNSLAAVYRIKSESPGALSGKDLYALVKGTMIMDRQEAAERLERIAVRLGQTGTPQETGRRIVVSGSVCDAPLFYNAVEQAGATVVGDDLCTGERWFQGPVQEDIDPLTAVVQRYMARAVCPAKHLSVTARGDHLVSLARDRRADGVVFLLLKFCDPHAFDYPYLKEYLENAGIKTLLIDIESQSKSPGQIATRLETFVQMI